MAKKKKTSKRRSAAQKSPSLSALATRVQALENDFSAMRGDMTSLSDDVAGLKKVVKQVDERTLRGEKLMLDMQGEQRRTAKMIDRIAQHFSLTVEPPVPHSATPTEDEAPPDADDPE